LFFAPAEASSGESITAFRIASSAVDAGDTVCILVSPFAARFCPPRLASACRPLVGLPETVKTMWYDAVRDFRPEAIVFADYPLLSFSADTNLPASKDWLRDLEDLDVALFTLDHLGYAQRPGTIYFGPPHLSMYAKTMPPVPSRMRLLLPCPVQEPGPIAGRRGTPVTYRDLPLHLDGQLRRLVRRRYLDDDRDYLVVHTVPTWAWRIAQQLDLPYYELLPQLFAIYFSAHDRPVTIVSVNNGHLLGGIEDSTVRIRNIPPLAMHDYEELLLACDLMLTENAVSVSLGEAICGLIPCAVLQNSFRLSELMDRVQNPIRRILIDMEARKMGAVFPYRVFPLWRPEDVASLGILLDNSMCDGCEPVEVYGGEDTRTIITDLMIDEKYRSGLQIRQLRYLMRLKQLDRAHEAIHNEIGTTDHGTTN
jgi:hypothetical protein